MPNSAVLSEPTRAALPGQRLAAARGSAARGRPNTALLRGLFASVMAECDATAIIGVAVLVQWMYPPAAENNNALIFGLMVALLFVVPNLLRHNYAITRYLSFKGHAKEALLVWSIAFLTSLVVAFLTRTSQDYSRGAAILLFGAGLASLLGVRALLVHWVSARAGAGRLAARTIFLVGDESMIRTFMLRHNPQTAGLRLVGASVLRPGPESVGDDLALAAASARVLRPDDIHILVPWSDRIALEACIETFMRIPAAIHLGSEHFFDKFADMHVVRNGPIASIHLVRSPLSPSEVLLKRAVDIVASSIGLFLLMPVFAAAAIAIKLDSKGPALFRQRRYGFNQEPFRILKFRSMRTLEDDRLLRQVTSQDPRVTRVGRFLRRTNIDELPQLINVLKGDMSLVGPRPHALAHDQAFERGIALYARRHNVRPGITGWAQVNGWRGETDTPEKVHGRVEHDLFYIDNWSLLFDLAILVRTLLSRKAYRNAG